MDEESLILVMQTAQLSRYHPRRDIQIHHNPTSKYRSPLMIRFIRSIIVFFALPLALSAQSAPQAKASPTPAPAPAAAPAPMCPEMMHQQMAMHQEMDALDARLDALVAAMNGAKGEKKIAAMAAVINEMTAQRKILREKLEGMHAGMMGGMHHGGGDCPMMKDGHCPMMMMHGGGCPMMKDGKPCDEACMKSCHEKGGCGMMTHDGGCPMMKDGKPCDEACMKSCHEKGGCGMMKHEGGCPMMKDGKPCDEGCMKACQEKGGCPMMKGGDHMMMKDGTCPMMQSAPPPAASSPHADHH
jgi:hypothetical protein